MKRIIATIALALLVLGAAIERVDAAFTAPFCLATKLKAWGKFVYCDSRENGKLIRGKPFDLAKCRTKLDAKLVKLDARADALDIQCRHIAVHAGTVTDPATGLEWETKSSTGGVEGNYADPHDVNNRYSWCIGSFAYDGCRNTTTGAPDGTMFTDFLAKLNNCTSTDGVTIVNAGFAGHCDWRIPTVEELRTIYSAVPGCSATVPCIDPAFGPTYAGVYWSNTTYSVDVDYAWGVIFTDTGPTWADYKFPAEHARAVRGGFTQTPPPLPPTP